MAVVLVSGWGLGVDLWARVIIFLKNYPWLEHISVLDLGISIDFPPVVRSRLIVAHSTGVLWLLRQRPFSWDGFISVNGFTRFARGVDFPEGVEKRLLERMLYHLDHNPVAARTTFLEKCGVQTLLPLRNSRYLKKGLMWLLDWDARGSFSSLEPLLVLAGYNDSIVSPAMTRACFKSLDNIKIIWHPDGGHVLPLSHPEWLAVHIGAFSWYLLLSELEKP